MGLPSGLAILPLTVMCSGFHVAGGVWTMATLGGWCALVAPSAASSRSLRDSCLLMVAFPLEWLRPTPCPVSVQFLTTADLLLGQPLTASLRQRAEATRRELNQLAQLAIASCVSWGHRGQSRVGAHGGTHVYRLETAWCSFLPRPSTTSLVLIQINQSKC